MYLKKIEVQGFKSFANKLVFEFDNGITGIVGPNGSGKSNIADAVRWVLGEQSAKQLRGSKMEDIIFAGTQARKPVSFAAVSLTIDNADHQLDIDYDEVTVTRRVFRSGESEYLLNGSNCRLKDINELFYDTGIGKEGYSIIGQGQIDKILSGKPDERRELFDEAAGIVKYKRRKAEAQKSLARESDNLVRVNDILSELERQVGPLAKQSEKAREYLKLKEELKKIEINLFLMESDSIKEKINEYEDKLHIVENDMGLAKQEYDHIKNVYDEKNALIEAVTREIDEITALNNQAQIDKNRLISHIEVLKEQIKTAGFNDAHIAERIAEINEQIEERSEEKAKLLKEKFSLDEQINNVSAKKDDADKLVRNLSQDIESITEQIDENKNTVMENLNKKGVIKTNIQRYETMLEQIGIRKAELNSKLIDFKTNENRFDDSLTANKTALNNIDNEISALESENSVLITQKTELRNKRQDNERRLSEAKEQNMRSRSRLDTLKNIAERYDGYTNSIRRVMEKKEQEKGILGVVADIVKTKKQYEIAIETALGGTIQNIVTDNEHTAKKMIGFLKQNKLGRATFLPLSIVGSKNNRKENISGEPGFIGYASELVTVDEAYKGLSEYLLGRCIVADTIDSALSISKKHNHSLKIVTLEGELLNPGGAMTGGAFKNSSNLLGRRREIEDLEDAVNRTEKTVVSTQNVIDEINEQISDITEQYNANLEKVQNKKIERNTALMEYNQAVSKQNEIKSLYAENKKEIADIDGQIKEINENLQVYRSELEQIETDNETATRLAKELAVTVENKKSELADKTGILADINIEYSEVSQKNEFIEESIKRALREISRLKESIEEFEDNKTDSAKEIQDKTEEIEKLKDTIDTAQKTIEGYEIKCEELKENKKQLSESVKGFFESRESCQEKLVELEKEQFRLSQNVEKLQNDRDSKIDYMWNEYELTISQAAELKDESLVGQSELKKEVLQIKGSIKKLGDVNVNAIEDYKDVSERYEFLKTQHDDLVVSRDRLLEVIADLDSGMRTRFTEKFEQIKTEFDKVFKQLFGGGKGTIEIDSESDILDADISIISQPPGKKLQNMMQLSGGEKALTAICLLFAIQSLKPSPFCLLDEIEAALDDSNVDRYAKYLHNLTKNTQFIVITHRRGTMAAADRLYGITMQEKGVSTLVSVDLIENQLDNPKKE